MYDLYDEVRLVGIRLDELCKNTFYQESLFEDGSKKINDEKLEKVLDNLKDKYGKNIIKKANNASINFKN